ncbi:Uncharacterised protein [uncultured archaeon]|nr:Uncharacterised protein [uncultured archaeon]
MCECCNSRMWALKLLIVGIVFIINQVYLKYDIWVVIAVLLIIKAIILFIVPGHCTCESDKPKKKK